MKEGRCYFSAFLGKPFHPERGLRRRLRTGDFIYPSFFRNSSIKASGSSIPIVIFELKPFRKITTHCPGFRLVPKLRGRHLSNWRSYLRTVSIDAYLIPYIRNDRYLKTRSLRTTRSNKKTTSVFEKKIRRTTKKYKSPMKATTKQTIKRCIRKTSFVSG